MLTKEQRIQNAVAHLKQIGCYKPYLKAYQDGTITMYEGFGGYYVEEPEILEKIRQSASCTRSSGLPATKKMFSTTWKHTAMVSMAVCRMFGIKPTKTAPSSERSLSNPLSAGSSEFINPMGCDKYFLGQ